MISWIDVKKLQEEKLSYQIKLNEILHSTDMNSDQISELKSEILHIDKQINKLVGKKEIERQKELNIKRNSVDKVNLEKYYILKEKYKKISNINVATKKFIDNINELNEIYEDKESTLKVKVA